MAVNRVNYDIGSSNNLHVVFENRELVKNQTKPIVTQQVL